MQVTKPLIVRIKQLYVVLLNQDHHEQLPDVKCI